MAYPASVVTRTCTVGGSAAVESGTDLVLSVSIEASRGLIRDGERMPSSPEVKTSTAGGEVSFDLPVSDQSGYRDEATGAVIDVSAPDSHTHTYTATITTTRGSKLVNQRVVNFPLPTGDLSPTDVDMLVDAGTVAGVLVSVPDSLSARLDALEAGGGTGGGVAEVSRTVTLPADGPRVVQMYTVGSAIINGETFAVDTALVARRTAAGVWQVAVVDSADWRAFVVVPDTTAPSAPTGLSATAATSTSVNLAWSASTDAVGVTGYEYRIGSGAAVDAGAGASETVSGLIASTAYSFTVRAYDAAGNRSGWSTAATVTTPAGADTAPPSVGTLASSAITETGFTLTVSGASDAVGLHATPYAFSTDNGTNWSAYQSSAVYVASGLAATTGYQARHKVRDAAGNEATGTAITVTTSAPALTPEQAALALSPLIYLPLDDAVGSTTVANLGSLSPAVTFGPASGSTPAPVFGATTVGGRGTSVDMPGSGNTFVGRKDSFGDRGKMWTSETLTEFTISARFGFENFDAGYGLWVMGGHTDGGSGQNLTNGFVIGGGMYVYGTDGNFWGPIPNLTNGRHTISLTAKLGGECILYVDGAQFQTPKPVGATTFEDSSSFYVGNRSTQATALNGRVSDFLLAPIQATPAQVLALHQSYGATP